MKNILVIGYGEIGKSIHGLYKRVDPEGTKYRIITKDSKEYSAPFETIDVMHICFTYNDMFLDNAIAYITEIGPGLVIIHSTMPPGTTRKIADDVDVPIAVSPVMGMHPDLTESILTFRKLLGGSSDEAVILAKGHLAELDVKTEVYNLPEEVELAKLFSTTYYGWNIYFMQEVHKVCEEQGVSFENVYKKTNEIYNEGYTKLGLLHVRRPILKFVGRGCGGHCIIQNCEILNKFGINKTLTSPVLSLGKSILKGGEANAIRSK